MKTALITGITGQDGSYLAELLLAKGYRVVGLSSSHHSIGLANIQSIQNQVQLVDGDLLDEQSLRKVIQETKPDEIYNLAGLTFVPGSWEKPVLFTDINLLGPLRILSLVQSLLPSGRFYQASTAKIFGDPADNPQTEKTPIQPTDPYGAAKAGAHFVTQLFRQHFGLFAVSGILYNHESERRGEEFVTRKITMAAAKIKKGLVKTLALGSLEAKQDWGYAPDYVEAMWLMLQQDKPDDYIIATETLHSVKEVCQTAFDEVGLDWQKYVVTDKKFIRKETAKALYGDASKARQQLGWQPRVSFEAMIRKMVRYDLHLLTNSKEKV
jgi:GDPmannose 4,6-dehydratase